MTASLREQIAAKVGVTEELSPRGGNAVLDGLRKELQGLAPEVLAGDEKATAEAARIEAAIADEERRVRLADLAAVEQAARDRAAAEAEAEKARQDAAAAKVKAEAERSAEVAKAEALIGKLRASLERVFALDSEVAAHGAASEGKPGYSYPRALLSLKAAWYWDIENIARADGMIPGPRPEIPEAFLPKPPKKASKASGGE